MYFRKADIISNEYNKSENSLVIKLYIFDPLEWSISLNLIMKWSGVVFWNSTYSIITQKYEFFIYVEIKIFYLWGSESWSLIFSYIDKD